MFLEHRIVVDLTNKRKNVIHVVQDDSTRRLDITLLANGNAYDVGADLAQGETVVGLVSFYKPDGNGGQYDTANMTFAETTPASGANPKELGLYEKNGYFYRQTKDTSVQAGKTYYSGSGETAVSRVDGTQNCWIAILDGQCFTAPGITTINVSFFTESGKFLSTFSIEADVQPNAASTAVSGSYYRIESIADLREAVQHAVLFSPQTLTAAQKSQARQNIDATDIFDVEHAIDHVMQPLNDSVVKHTAQTLTNQQKAQARRNVGAVDASYVGDYVGVVIDKSGVELPAEIRGTYSIGIEHDGDSVIAGTHNVSQLLNIKEGTATINDVTITVNGNSVEVSGTATSSFNYHLETASVKTAQELANMTLPLPVHLYSLSSKATSADFAIPAVCIRSKTSGNVAVAQNTVSQFTMNEETCGGIYLAFVRNQTYFGSFAIAVLPYETTRENTHREEASSVDVVTVSGVHELEGYAWIVGTPTIVELKSKIPKKPLCRYSTRTIPSSRMIECLDVYIPAATGYVNYVFGHTQDDATGGDVWRLVQVDAVTDGLEYRFHVTTFGETEMALKISGRDDFIGGTAHGDEIDDAGSLLLVIDGKPVSVSSLTNVTEFETLRVFASSTMYDPDDHETIVGAHGRTWVFNREGLYIGQTVEFTEDLDIAGSYMPMVCAVRGNDSVSALQITDTYADDGSYKTYDVSQSGFTNYPREIKDYVRNAILTGHDSGVTIATEILERPETSTKHGIYLSNNDAYNKLYNCVCGYGDNITQSVTSGTRWKVKAKIKVELN